MNINETISALINEEMEKLFEKKGGFKFEEFRSLPSGEAMYQYAKKYLPFLQKGTERATFAWKAGKVLKISYRNGDAANTASNYQNKLEINALTSGKYNDLLPKIYDFDPYYNWLIVEGVKVIEDNADVVRQFKNVTRIPNLLYAIFYNAQGRHSLSFEDNLHQALKSYFKNEFADRAIEQTMSSFTEMEMELMEKIHIGATKDFYDIARFDHWGITSSGRVVLADAGLVE